MQKDIYSPPNTKLENERLGRFVTGDVAADFEVQYNPTYPTLPCPTLP